MAFNFNWSPLTADASFYTRAQELLTTALNKSPKPPIIVDDILVNELNLGSVPPDLEILEIGDLAEDRFRGIFKMCYSGDAFLTLKTRVQANPLNTYLSTRPYFTSPQPLAAASGLTIPLKITLSEIKLSAFIILVFSRQKGLTLVFRNDPLESLKVSSTFDSIPFVREYLQMEIEGQLRTLLMDEVPAIIHRLSLRLWVPEYQDRENQGLAKSNKNPLQENRAADPLASPPQDPVDLTGHPLDAAQIVSLSLDSSAEIPSLFSQKNLLRLGVLTNSQKTLSLFTPTIRDAVFRAWAGPTERGELFGNNPPATPMLSRAQSYIGSISTTYTYSHDSEGGHSQRPAHASSGSQAAVSGIGGNRKAHGGRKRKHRVVNLRKKNPDRDDLSSLSCEGSTVSGITSSAPSEIKVQTDDGDELMTPPRSPEKTWQRNDLNSIDFHSRKIVRGEASDATPKPSTSSHNTVEALYSPKPAAKVQPIVQPGPPIQLPQQPHVEKPSQEVPFSPTLPPMTYLPPFPYTESNNVQTGILEQAWVMKMAGEIARQVHDQKAANNGFWDRNDEGPPPPAYGS